MLKIALIGAGYFARDAHVPALLKHSSMFEVVAIYSRTEKSAQILNTLLSKPADIYHDIDVLLARPDIDAVIITLPIHLLPWAVEKSLVAGKHVLSEKPMAPTKAIGEDMLKVAQNYKDKKWMIAENWCYSKCIQRAAEAVSNKEIGDIILSHWAVHIDMTPEIKYYNTDWRQNPRHMGGFIFDVGVHHIAALRMILGEIETTKASVSQIKPDLLPADSIAAAIKFNQGLLATYAVTFAGWAACENTLNIVGTKGTLFVDNCSLKIVVGDDVLSMNSDECQGLVTEHESLLQSCCQQQARRNYTRINLSRCSHHGRHANTSWSLILKGTLNTW